MTSITNRQITTAGFCVAAAIALLCWGYTAIDSTDRYRTIKRISDSVLLANQHNDKKWQQLLIDSDFAHYNGKTGKWTLYTKEEFLMNNQVPQLTEPKSDEALFSLPTNEPAVVPIIKKKK